MGESSGSLRKECLGFSGITAMAIALISPTMTAALIVPLMYGTAGNASWLANLFGTVMLLFVALNLNQFAKRSTSAGSMYGYTMMGIHMPALPLFVVCAASIWYLGYKDIRLSSGLMLVMEGLSVALILLLCSIVLFGQKSVIDPAQLKIEGGSFSGISLGVVVAIFSLVGFECATAFGEEARNPLQTIPRAVIVSLLLTGAFFVFVSYTEVLGFASYKTTLDKIDAPLNVLSDMMHVGWLKAPISFGAMASFYSLALSCMNSGARILYPMGKLGVFHSSVGASHETNETPHVAVTVMSVLIFSSAVILTQVFQLAVLDAFNDAGTFGAFGFLGAYFLISIAAPAYLSKRGELGAGALTFSIASVVLLTVPAVGSVYPVPSWPVNIFPYIFLGYVAIGMTWFMFLRRNPDFIASVKDRIHAEHATGPVKLVVAATPDLETPEKATA